MPRIIWHVLACVLIIAAASPLPARAQSKVRLEITDYGLYEVVEGEAKRDANGVLQGTVTNERHLATTTKVPAKLGVHFGFHYRIIGTPKGASVTFKKVVIYPPPGVQPTDAKMPIERNDRMIAHPIGETSYTDYSFDEAWELAAGTWVFQLWQDDRKLLEKTFTVVAP